MYNEHRHKHGKRSHTGRSNTKLSRVSCIWKRGARTAWIMYNAWYHTNITKRTGTIEKRKSPAQNGIKRQKIDSSELKERHTYITMKYHNTFAALDSDNEMEEAEITKQEELFLLGRNFWEEQQKGNYMTWGDWCDEDEDDDGILSGDECIVWKGVPCSNKKCSYRAHSKPPKHFTEKDRRFCCSKCRLSGGKYHGGHCQKK